VVRNSLRLVTSIIFAVGASIFATPSIAQEGCEPTLVAETSAGAMVRLAVSSTCHAGQSVVIHHNGMMISEMMDDTGMLLLAIPALTETAFFMAELGTDGSVAVATTAVPSLSFYDRVALQWKGNSGLELHAREFEGAYMSEDHVWRETPQSMDRAALGEGGFLVSLGREDAAEGNQAEVYTFPSATVSRVGTVLMSVEAVISQGNCATDVAAQAIQVKSGGDLAVRELSISMPSCDSEGDIIVLGALVDDIKIGSN
jgi:hypothetical protein